MLKLEQVVKRFGGVLALDGVDLDVRAGEVVGLIGPNGAGKTTLFDVVSGVHTPTSGSVRLDGRPIGGKRPETRARLGIRRTFQRLQLYPRLSVEDNVLTATEWRGGGGGVLADLVGAPPRRRLEAQRRTRVMEVLEACGISELRAQAAGSLPIGQARLVELARAIVDQPRMLLLDEPTSGLARHEADVFGEQVNRLRGTGASIVLVEHDVGFVMDHADRVVVLDLGRVLAEGTPEEIQAHTGVQEAYLGMST